MYLCMCIKQDGFSGYSGPMPGIRRCPLPPIEAAKNGLPCSHGGRIGMDNGRAGWTPDQSLWCYPYIYKHSMPPNPAILTQTLWLSVWDNDACRKRKLQNPQTDNSRICPVDCLELLTQSWFVLIVRLKQVSAQWFTYFKHVTLKILSNTMRQESV